MSPSPTSTVRALALGLDAPTLEACRTALGADAQMTSAKVDLEALIEQEMDPPPHLVLCGPEIDPALLTEFAQALRMKFQHAAVFFVTSKRAGFERKLFHKNGFNDSFLIPIDTPLLEKVIKEAIATASGGEIKAFRSVKLIDLVPGVTMDFDTYLHLPSNHKHIKFSNAGSAIDEAQAKRLRSKSSTQMTVTHDQIQKFYQFTASQLRKLEGDKAISETEKRERVQTAIRELMGGIFNDSVKEASTTHGKSVVADCQEIVKAYIVSGSNGKGGNDWYQKLLQVSGGENGSYSHAANVATFAALFSMGTGIGKAEEIGIASILHDIGLADIPMDVQLKNSKDRTAEEEALYQKHVDLSLKLIQDRKLVVAESVLKMVAQHHERFDGTGYPKKLSGKRVLPEAQILALADEFDYLISGSFDGKKMSPIQALRFILSRNASTAYYDPDIVAKVATLFPEATASQAAA